LLFANNPSMHRIKIDTFQCAASRILELLGFWKVRRLFVVSLNIRRRFCLTTKSWSLHRHGPTRVLVQRDIRSLMCNNKHQQRADHDSTVVLKCLSGYTSILALSSLVKNEPGSTLLRSTTCIKDDSL